MSINRYKTSSQNHKNQTVRDEMLAVSDEPNKFAKHVHEVLELNFVRLQ